MILTKQNIHAALNNGSPNNEQCRILGIKYPLPGGWLRRLVGRYIPDEDYNQLQQLRRVNPEKGNGMFHSDPNVKRVQDKMAKRAALGLKKYGVGTDRTDLSRLDWLNHAQQEAMDLAIYLERLIQEEKTSS